MDNIIYFELNNWMPDDDYPNAEPFIDWMRCDAGNNYYIRFRDKEWINKNKLVVVESLVDMSCNYCITAKVEWIKKNCPELLTKYKEFIVIPEEDEEIPYGRFGCPFLEYTNDNIGYHIAYEKEDSQGYWYYSVDDDVEEE